MSGNEPIAVVEGLSIHIEGATPQETVVAQITAIPGEVRCKALEPVDESVEVVDMEKYRSQQPVDSGIKSGDQGSSGSDDTGETTDTETKKNNDQTARAIAPKTLIKHEQEERVQNSIETSSDVEKSPWSERKSGVMSNIASCYR